MKKSEQINMRPQNYNISRFLDSQENVYPIALKELHNGRKHSHWMWFISPQIKGLGHSMTSIFFSIKDIEEAKEYLNHTLLS